MNVNSLMYLSILFFLGGCNFNKNSPKLDITQQEMTVDTMEIKYQVQNNSSEIFWFCEDVSVILPFDEICDIKGTVLYVNRRVSAFPGPDVVLFDEPMIGKYISIKPSQTKNFTIDISLFERFESFSNYENRPSFAGIDRIVLSVGYLDENLCDKYLNLKNIDDKESSIHMELSQFIKEMHENIEDPESLYIPHFWEGIKKEKVLRARVNGK